MEVLGPSTDEMAEEAKIEQMLSEKLMDGFVLLESSCPICSTPLVKNYNDDEDEVEEEEDDDMEPVVVQCESDSPIIGVPFCVSCLAHIATHSRENELLEQEQAKAKGPERIVIDVTDIPDPVDETNTKDPADLYTEEKKEEMAFDPTTEDYSVRRQVATKVLGAKMLQGYSLTEQQCTKCSMPMMEHEGAIDCVVCPVLLKKAKKKLKAQQKVEEESIRLQDQIKAARAKKEAEETKAEQEKREEIIRAEREKVEQQARERELALKKEQDEEVARRLALVEQETNRIAAMEEEQARMQAEAKEVNEKLEREQAEQAEIQARKTAEENEKLEQLRKASLEKIDKDYALATQRRQQEEILLADETKRLEELENRRKLGLTTAFENLNRDVLVAEHRRRLQAKAKLDAEILRLEQDRVQESLESRKVADEKRSVAESLMIATLEEEARAKAEAAEEAIKKAKEALEHVHSARKDVIAQTIALAEQEAIAEAELHIKLEREGYKAPVILPTASDIKRENWETLRAEGRSVMTRRVMTGWVLLPEFCQGAECHRTPLITKSGVKECVVCGGCGSGTDGVYAEKEEDDVVITEGEFEEMRAVGVLPDDMGGYEIGPNATGTLSPTANLTVKQIQDDFETKRDMVSKEIGKRMIEGWTLLDASCPRCVMPLMMDPEGTNDVCVLCGLVSNLQNDGSAIKHEDVPDEIDDNMNTALGALAIESGADHVTQPAPYDAVTVDSTIPTIDEATLSTTVVGASKDHTLTDTIRQSLNRPNPVTPRGDPPACSTKNEKTESKKRAQDPSSGPLKSFDLAQDENVQQVIKAAGEEIRHLGRSPEMFTFGNEDVLAPSTEESTYTKKSRPTPETMSRDRKSSQGRGTISGGATLPPRPGSAGQRTKGNVIVEGGPTDIGHVPSSDSQTVGDASRAESVATEALDSILDRIERAKAKLLRDDISVQEQVDTANLIEKLAQAAVAVKALEKLDY
eukprot:Nitzschia sp. Nitz4//scaffold139_size61406//21186//24205//NITZ4_006453-RA/size61406-snap-gene-0.10-mRNA-1//-1//CDS//3329535831//2827//frame0